MDYWLVAWRLLMSFILVLFFFQLYPDDELRPHQ